MEVAERQPITKQEFFKSIDMTSASFRGKAKDSPLNSNAIVNIITKYPETDLHWLLLGDTHVVQESSKEYSEANADDKDRLIEVLLDQIAELKSDKEDLKKLLGLRKDS